MYDILETYILVRTGRKLKITDVKTDYQSELLVRCFDYCIAWYKKNMPDYYYHLKKQTPEID